MEHHEELREERKFIPYDPTHKWWEPPLRAWIPNPNREVLLILFVWNVIVVVAMRFVPICGDAPDEYKHSKFCDEEVWILANDAMISTLGIGLFMLLAFRANQSYNRFWEGRIHWGRTKNACRDLVRQICFFITAETKQEMQARRRAVAMVSAFASTLKLHLRKERNCVPELGSILCFQDVLNIEKAIVMPQFCADSISYYLQEQVQNKRASDYQVSVMNSTGLTTLIDALGALERIRKTPIPLSYSLHLRFIMLFWMFLYPFNLVVYYGFFTIPLAFLVDYVILGIETMSCEIEEPFGYDKNDLDLCKFCKVLQKELFEILERREFENHAKLFQSEEVHQANEVLIANATQEERDALAFLSKEVQK